jgi:hypothetical protein
MAVTFRSHRSSAMMMFGRARPGATLPVQVGTAFVFSGTSPTDEEAAIRRTRGGRDANH